VEKDEALAVDIVSAVGSRCARAAKAIHVSIVAAVNAGGEVAITQKACEPCQGFLI
jgi:hypothetical protein